MFFKIALLLAVFVYCFADRDSDFVDECLKDNAMTEQQLMSYSGNIFTDKYLCYLKCVSMKKGILDADGNINLERVDLMTGEYKFSKQDMSAFMDCIGEVGPIRKCKDMLKIDACYDEIYD